MDWTEYCAFTKTTAAYPKGNVTRGLDYIMLKLVGELGEFITANNESERSVELGDIVWYVGEYHNILDLPAARHWQIVTPPAFNLFLTETKVLALVGALSERVGKVLRRGVMREEDVDFLTAGGVWLMVLVKALLNTTGTTLTTVMSDNKAKLTARKNEGTIVDEAKRKGTL